MPRGVLSSGAVRDYYGISIEEDRFADQILALMATELDRADAAEGMQRHEHNIIAIELFDFYMTSLRSPRERFHRRNQGTR